MTDEQKKVVIENQEPTLTEQLQGTIQNFGFACTLVRDVPDRDEQKKQILNAIRAMKSMYDILE